MPPNPVGFLLVFLGAGLGGCARYLLTLLLSPTPAPGSLPWNTIITNLTGCLAIGLLAALIPGSSTHLRLLVLVGVLGGYTTFSSYSRESIDLFQQGHLAPALINVAVSNIGGLLLTLAGLWIGRQLA
jgi:CrcB protein